MMNFVRVEREECVKRTPISVCTDLCSTKMTIECCQKKSRWCRVMVVEVGSYCFGYGIEVGDSMRGGGGGGDSCGKSYRRNYVAERRIRSSSINSQDGASSEELKHQYNKHTSSTSFAAAISPHPYNRMKNKRKNTSATPLLGQGLHVDKKNKLTLFMNNLRLPFKTNNRISTGGGNCNNNTKKKRSFKRSLSNASVTLKKASSPKRAEKKEVVVEKKHVIETPITRKTSYEQLAKARAPLNHPPNTVIESDNNRSNTLDISDYSAQSIRFAVDFNVASQIDKCTRLTPLSFDGSADMNFTNHFRSLDATGERRQETARSSTSPYYTDGFSLQRCLTPASYTPSFQSLDENMMIKDEVALSDRSGSFVPIPMILEQPLLLEEPLHSEDKGDCSSSSLHYSTSDVSLPSLVAEESNDIIMTSQESGPTTNKDGAADSTIAWGFLSAILGSPAPKSLLDNKKQKKRVPFNLWQDGGDAEEELENAMMSSVDVPDDDVMPRVDSHDSLPSLSGHDDVSDSNQIPNMNDESLVPQVQIDTPSTSDAADSTLAWTVFSAILSSPAPKALLDNKKRVPVNLWQDDCRGYKGDDLDDIISLPQDHNDFVDECESLDECTEQDLVNAPDNCSIPSVSWEADEDEDTIPNIDNVTEVSTPSLATPTKSKEAADSTLAWTLLGAVLGAPAPCITKKKTKKEHVNLWKDDDEESSGILPEIDEQENEIPVLELDDALEDLADGADNCSLPSISSEAHMNEDIESILEVPLSSSEQVLSKQAADSTLAWTVLSAILGSPAPKSLLDILDNKKRARKTCVNLWGDDREETDQLPDIVDDGDDLDELLTKFQALNLSSLEDVVDATDNFSIPSMSSEVQIEDEEDEEDTIPNVDDADDVEDVPFCLLTPKNPKDAADSTLAWTILSAVLGSPAPSSVTKKKTKKEHVNLWQDDDDESAVLPDMEKQHNEDTSSPKSVVGKLSSTDAVARNLFDDFNCARNDTMNTNTKSPTSTVRRAIFTTKERMAAARNATMLLSSTSLPNITSNKEEVLPSRRSASNPNLSSSKRSIFSEEEKFYAASNCTFKRRDSTACKSPEVIPRLDEAEEDDDDFSMPSLSSTTDDDDSSSRLTQSTCLSSPPSSKEQAENVLAWSALGMLLGSPAPKVTKQKRYKKETAQNPWNDSNSVQDLVEIWEDRSS